MLAKQEVIIFRVQSKHAQAIVLYLIRVRIEKQDYEVRQKVKSNI